VNGWVAMVSMVMFRTLLGRLFSKVGIMHGLATG